MGFKVLFFLLLILSLSCKSDSSKTISTEKKNAAVDSTFNQARWLLKEDGQYAYRELMFRNVLYNDTIRTLNLQQLVTLLGKPDYTEGLHYYYRIVEKNLGSWTLSSKTMVVKFTDSTKIEWIKLHE